MKRLVLSACVGSLHPVCRGLRLGAPTNQQLGTCWHSGFTFASDAFNGNGGPWSCFPPLPIDSLLVWPSDESWEAVSSVWWNHSANLPSCFPPLTFLLLFCLNQSHKGRVVFGSKLSYIFMAGQSCVTGPRAPFRALNYHPTRSLNQVNKHEIKTVFCVYKCSLTNTILYLFFLQCWRTFFFTSYLSKKHGQKINQKDVMRVHPVPADRSQWLLKNLLEMSRTLPPHLGLHQPNLAYWYAEIWY